MRTKQINGAIAVLVCGGNGARVYSQLGHWIVQIGRKNFRLDERHPDYSAVSQFTTIKYQDITARPAILAQFAALINKLKGQSDEASN